jgi:hypothetical protein
MKHTLRVAVAAATMVAGAFTAVPAGAQTAPTAAPGATTATYTGTIGYFPISPIYFNGPGYGSPWVVSVGDSAISGEAGRWAGNTNNDSSEVDALGSTAYYDNGSNTAEAIPGCHRSKSAEVFIGGGVNGQNLACSGARTYTQAYSSGNDFKPGLDFYNDGAGHIGQALALQSFAATHNVKSVVVLIGANNFHFADLVQACVVDWYYSPSWWPDYCYDDSSVAANFTASNVAAQTAAIKGGLLNIHQAMVNDGYTDSMYSIVVQTYSAPLPKGAGFRYPQTGYTRQTVGGCGVWNVDADWANNTAVPTINTSVKNGAAQTGLSNIRILDDSAALNGHRLCENTVGLLEEVGLSSWTQSSAADRTEWVSQIRTSSTIFGPYQLQEGLHPSYWGQLALRNCFRQAYNGGAARSGTCTPTGGKNAQGEPNMSLH